MNNEIVELFNNAEDNLKEEFKSIDKLCDLGHYI